MKGKITLKTNENVFVQTGVESDSEDDYEATTPTYDYDYENSTLDYYTYSMLASNNIIESNEDIKSEVCLYHLFPFQILKIQP